MQPNHLLRKRLALSGKIVSYLTMLIALFVVLGWGLFFDFLKQFHINGFFMNPLTAAFFFLISISYLLLLNTERKVQTVVFARLVAILIIGSGSTILAGYFLGKEIMIDKLKY